jgi:MFS transporter, YNFM family, putative membrane transport protein
VVADLAGWRVGVAGLAAGTLLVTLALYRTMPARDRQPGRRGHAHSVPLRLLVTVSVRHLADPRLRGLYVLAFCCMGSFVALYNYVGFRLVAPPYDVRPAVVGLVYLSYVAGSASSAVAGRLADAWGRRRVVLGGLAVFGAGVALTLPTPFPVVLAGLVVATTGFFAVHATASGWVAKRATHARAHASALYLLAYYTGSSVLGWALGLPFEYAGWGWLVGCVLAILSVATAVAVRLGRSA